MKALIYRFKNKISSIALLIASFGIYSCEPLNVMPDHKDYNPETGMSTVEYFRSLQWDGDQEYDLLADLIERSSVDLSNKTFFAPADNNWEKWMQDNGWATVADVPVQEINDALREHLLDGRFTRLELDLPDRDPQTLEGTDLDSEVVNIAGNSLFVNVNYFNNNGRGYYYRVGTGKANKLIMVGDVANTDAIVNLMGFQNDGNQGKGLLLP